jgi:hypothetical protein
MDKSHMSAINQYKTPQVFSVFCECFNFGKI